MWTQLCSDADQDNRMKIFLEEVVSVLSKMNKDRSLTDKKRGKHKKIKSINSYQNKLYRLKASLNPYCELSSANTISYISHITNQ